MRRSRSAQRAALPLLLLLAATGAAAAAAPGAAGLAAPHVVFGAECSPYMDWQSIAVVYSHRKAGMQGPITRLLTCSPETLASYRNLDLVPTHLAPSYTNHHAGDSYLALNKPGAIMHWLQQAPPTEDWVLVIDPDMILRDSFADWGRVYGAERGWAVSVHFGYMAGVANNLSATHVPEIAPRQDAFAGPRGRRGDQVSALVLMHRDDLAAVAPRWLHYSEVVRDDPMAWNETGDEYATVAGLKPWIAEMYGYSFGAATAGVWHRIDYQAMLYPSYTPVDAPMVLHFGRQFAIGPAYSWQKHWFLQFQALQCPPWPHMAEPLRGPEEAPRVTGGLFPHPPHPSLFNRLPPLERYTQLLSLQVITTINAALCERHLANCPPSEELERECSKAQLLERHTDAAIAALERGAPPDGEPLCKDLKPAEQCRDWAGAQLCWQDPRFMHWYCRETCGLCRLPAGRPQQPFTWGPRSTGSSSNSEGGGEAGSGAAGEPSGQAAPGGAAAGGQPSQQQRHRAAHPLARSEWHSLHASGAEADEGRVVAAAGSASHAILYAGLGGWAALLVGVLGLAARGIWMRRRQAHAALGSRGRQAGGSSGSGDASPTRPLLRDQAVSHRASAPSMV